jgi:ABC-type multidrug transport system ATPase subunit
MNADAAYQAPSLALEDVESRVEEIRTLASADQVDKSRKLLLELIQDYDQDIPNELRAGVVARSREFISIWPEFSAGFGDDEKFNKNTFELLRLAEQILDHFRSRPEQTEFPTPTDMSMSMMPMYGDPRRSGSDPKRLEKPDGGEKRAKANLRVVSSDEPHQEGESTPPELEEDNDTPATDAEVIFRANDISKRYRSTNFALSDVSFELKLGQITAIVGRNGSGKSTLLNIVLNRLAVGSGTIEYPYFDARGIRQGKRNYKIGYVAQRPPRWRGRVKENLEFMVASTGIRGDANINRVNWLLNRYWLAGFENHTWNQLSGGYQLRFELARSVVHRPTLLVLDEPLANLDIISQEEFLFDLSTLKKSMASPMSILITSQHIYEMEAIADQIVLLHDGKQLYCGDTESLGTTRQSNQFELGTSVPLAEVKRLLDPLNYESIADNITHYDISVPLEVGLKSVMLALAPIADDVIYVRDTSHSSKSYITDQRIRPKRDPETAHECP